MNREQLEQEVAHLRSQVNSISTIINMILWQLPQITGIKKETLIKGLEYYKDDYLKTGDGMAARWIQVFLDSLKDLQSGNKGENGGE